MFDWLCKLTEEVTSYTCVYDLITQTILWFNHVYLYLKLTTRTVKPSSVIINSCSDSMVKIKLKVSYITKIKIVSLMAFIYWYNHTITGIYYLDSIEYATVKEIDNWTIENIGWCVVYTR